MKRRFVRVLVLLYPPWFRRRYGAELEQLLVDAGAGGTLSRLESTRMVAGVAGTGLRQWFLYVGIRSRIAALALSAGLACLMINAVATGDASSPSSGSGHAEITLAVDALLGPGVRVTHRWIVPHAGQWISSGGAALVNVNPANGEVTLISKTPVHVVLNPNSGTVLSVTRLPTLSG